jgi:hypothetical protein
MSQLRDIKPRPHHKQYLQILRSMTPAQRLQKSFELTEHARQLLKDGLRRRHPDLAEQELHVLFLERLKRCHNQNY